MMLYAHRTAIFGICQILLSFRLVVGSISTSSFYGYATGGITDMYPQRAADFVVSVAGDKTMYVCLMMCGQTINCMSIFFKDDQCHHYHSGFVDTTVLSPDPGWRFYNVFTDGCPFHHGYIHSRPLGLCYKLHLGGPRNAYDSMATCAAEGGQLLKVTSQEIQDHISAFLTDATCHFVVLVQGSDRNSEGTFKFEDGTVLTYVNWYGTEPNNYMGDEDFLFLVAADGFKWADGIDIATTVSSFICEVEMV